MLMDVLLQDAANVVGPQALILVLDSTNDATCTYTGDGNVFITLTGGAPGYTYSWIDQDSTFLCQSGFNQCCFRNLYVDNH